MRPLHIDLPVKHLSEELVVRGAYVLPDVAPANQPDARIHRLQQEEIVDEGIATDAESDVIEVGGEELALQVRHCVLCVEEEDVAAVDLVKKSLLFDLIEFLDIQSILIIHVRTGTTIIAHFFV